MYTVFKGALCDSIIFYVFLGYISIDILLLNKFFSTDSNGIKKIQKNQLLSTRRKVG